MGRGRGARVTDVLSEIQAGYVQRARMAAYVSVSTPAPSYRPKATRTYSGTALQRRRYWGGSWAIIQKREAAKMYAAERT